MKHPHKKSSHILATSIIVLAIGASGAVSYLNIRTADKAIASANARATKAEQAASPARMKIQEIRELKARIAAHSDPTKPDVLANKKFPLIPQDYAPDVTTHPIGATIATIATDDFSDMLAAAEQDGTPLGVTSSYRSYNTQVTTYSYWVATSGTVEADKFSAKPGFSEHQTGLAVDFKAGACSLQCFDNTPQQAWLAKNAASYGFIERYPADKTDVTGYGHESWHYRYVGKQAAQDMKKKGISTLEEYWRLPGGDYRPEGSSGISGLLSR